jgi:hypothetical protein
MYVVKHPCNCTSQVVMVDDCSARDLRDHAALIARANAGDPLVERGPVRPIGDLDCPAHAGLPRPRRLHRG